MPTQRDRPAKSPWRSRGYLPHFERAGTVQSLTFRLGDSLPQELLKRWVLELAGLDPPERHKEQSRRIAAHLDRGLGACHLRDPRIAEVVENALLHFDDVRYRMLAWCVMPNHVHCVLEMRDDWTLDRVLHTWKSYTAKRANRILRRGGRFWQREYYDRAVRNWDHLLFAVDYVEMNPVRAGLVRAAEEWRWSSGWKGRRRPLIEPSGMAGRAGPGGSGGGWMDRSDMDRSD